MLSSGAHVAYLAAAEVIAPPPPINYERWAVENVVFSERESPMPGPYNVAAFPFFSEILNTFGPDDPCRIVTLKKSAQIGGTVLANVFTLGSQAMDPCDFLYVHPTEDNARRWSRLKLQPMLKATTTLARQFPSRPRDGGDSVFYKERIDGRGSILISGANSPAGLSMVTMRRQVQDDLSKYEPNSAGDPEKQADSRSRAHEFAKVFKNSTPLVAPGCKISKNYEAGSQEVYLVPCPQCGHEHALEWSNMLAQLDADAPEKTHFTCPENGCVIQEHHRPEMIRKGRWFAQNEKAKREHRSFYLWSAYSLLQSWERIAREWFAAEGDPASEQTFLNDTVGLAYEAAGEAPPWESLRDRAAQSAYARGQIPAGVLFLSLGVDCQGDRLEWQLVGWGRDLRRWVIDYGVIDYGVIKPYLDPSIKREVEAHISEAATQAALDALLKKTWTNSAGRQMSIDLTAIDGNAWTEDVWGWARKHPLSRVIMVRGRGEETAPLLAKVKKERTRDGKLRRWSGRFFNFGASVLKMALYRNVKKIDPIERGFVGFPRGLEDEYFRQLTSERRKPERRRDGFVTYKWVKDPGQANEGLDTMLQAEAAAIRIGVRTMPDIVWDRKEAEQETPPDDPQLDFEDTPLAQPNLQGPAPVSKPKRNTARRPGGFVGGWRQ